MLEPLGIDHGDDGLAVLGDDLFRTVFDFQHQVG